MSEDHSTTLLPSSRMREQALAGEVTQIHRGQAYATEGDQFEIGDEQFKITDMTERTLGDMTDEDARAEGARDLDHYKKILQHSHDEFEWDDENKIVRHRFEQV